ncbi:MAG: dihydropteroate synthase [Candidatus Omnitrophica bacterium]|nr:dihydropteroate synthase [Candidatus Omnitrophota bacterium]
MSFEKIRVAGILNVTPDSFSDGGEFFSPEKAVRRAVEMEKEGADLIDLGAESTRPGARPVSGAEELERLLPVLRGLRAKVTVPLSIDTTKPAVARAALKEGAEIINDVDGLHTRGEMAEVIREFQAGLILMHRRGTPESMQQLTQYEDVVEEVFEELDLSFREVTASGVHPEQIVLDPGIGFSKQAEQNLELIAGLERFHAWGRPILVGPSRKSFIGALIGKPAGERDWGTAGAAGLAVAYGAHLVRVHAVAEMREVVRVAEAIRDARHHSLCPGGTHVRS